LSVAEPKPHFPRALSPEHWGELWSKHVELPPDPGQTRFVSEARARPHSAFRTRCHRLLRAWLSDYDVNGLLEMYPMYLLGTDSWKTLLGGHTGGTLLDVGAGDGGLTQHLAPLFAEVSTTESSWAMARRLRQRGYTCWRRDIGEAPLPTTFDCVSCLNVVDRTPYPLRLIRALGRASAPGGCVVLASPLPLRAFYFDGPRTLTPAERLVAPGSSWERSARQLVRTVSEALPEFELECWTEAPYLSWGDSDESIYVLDDWVGVWRRARP
jgi:SAM-dependent methyltransferase